MASTTKGGSSASGVRRLDGLVYLFILIEACLYWSFCQHVEDIAPDSSAYQGLAHSLRNTGSYQFNFAPHIQYPPGLPLLLVGIGGVFGDDHFVFLRAMAVTATLGLWIAYEFLKREQGRAVAATCTLLLGVSSYYFTFAAIVLNSDVPYLFVSIAALSVAKRLERPGPPLQSLPLAIVLGFLLAFAVLLRSAGIALVGGFCLWLGLSWLKSRKLSAFRLETFGLPLALGLAAQAGWWLYVHRVKSQALSAWGGAYEEVFRLADPHQPELGYASAADILLRIPGNLVQHSAHLFELASGLRWIDESWNSPFVLLPMLLVAWGFIDSAYRRRGAAECYFFLYALIYSVWPYDVGARFVLPIFPIAFLYAWRATGLLSNLASEHPGRFALSGLAAGIALGAASLMAQRYADSPLGLQQRITPLLWLAGGAASGAVWYAQFRGSLVLSHGIGFLNRPIPAGRFAPPAAQWFGMLLLAALAAKGIANQAALGVEKFQRSPLNITHRASVEAATWIKAHAQASDIVMAQQLPIVHYVSGLRIVGFPATPNPQQIMAAIRNSGAKFLIVDTSHTGMVVLPTEAERLQALESAYGEYLQLVDAGTAGFQVFQISSAAEGASLHGGQAPPQ